MISFLSSKKEKTMKSMNTGETMRTAGSDEETKKIEEEKRKQRMLNSEKFKKIEEKYKLQLEVLRKNVDEDELNENFLRTFTPGKSGAFLYANYDKTHVKSNGAQRKTMKVIDKNTGKEVDQPYFIVPEYYDSGKVKMQSPVCLFSIVTGMYGPQARVKFRKDSKYDMLHQKAWNDHFDRECEILLQENLIDLPEGIDDPAMRLKFASAKINNPVYTPLIDKISKKKDESKDKSMTIKLLTYDNNKTTFMFPNGLKIPMEDLYGLTILALGIEQCEKIHCGSTKSSQRHLISAIVFDIRDSFSEDNMEEQREAMSSLPWMSGLSSSVSMPSSIGDSSGTASFGAGPSGVSFQVKETFLVPKAAPAEQTPPVPKEPEVKKMTLEELMRSK